MSLHQRGAPRSGRRVGRGADRAPLVDRYVAQGLTDAVASGALRAQDEQLTESSLAHSGGGAA